MVFYTFFYVFINEAFFMMIYDSVLAFGVRNLKSYSFLYDFFMMAFPFQNIFWIQQIVDALRRIN